MFANLLHLISRRTHPDYDQRFVERVAVQSKAPRNRRIERLILICWILIAVKCVVVVWAVGHYHIPFNPLWVIAPTLAFASLCTVVYFYWRS